MTTRPQIPLCLFVAHPAVSMTFAWGLAARERLCADVDRMTLDGDPVDLADTMRALAGVEDALYATEFIAVPMPIPLPRPA